MNVSLPQWNDEMYRRHGSVPIRFRERHGGEPSVTLGKFGEKAHELLSQLRALERETPRQ